ncbi:MAG TPA: hypothetical protein VI168_01310 [Croceibacterium sp.]
MRLTTLTLLLAILAAFMVEPASAAAGSDVDGSTTSESTASIDPAFDEQLDEAFNSSKTTRSTSDQLQLDLVAWQVQHYKKAWEWHHFTNQVIFWLVVGIVLFGMFTAWLQFRGDMRRSGARKPTALAVPPGEVGSNPAAPADDDPEDAADDRIRIIASLSQLEVRSKTIGVIILIASIVFFLLYLKYIYPMHVVDREDERIPFFSGAD